MTRGLLDAMLLPLACAAMLVSGGVNAQGRGPSSKELREAGKVDAAAARAAKLVELDAWLRRLLGRHRVSGQVGMQYSSAPCESSQRQNPGMQCSAEAPRFPPPTGFQGLADCVGIGTGPGVQCMINIVGANGTQFSLFPTMTLYGLDLDAPGIRYLQVDNKSVAESAMTELEGDTAVFKVRCPIIHQAMMETISCRREVRIHAPPDGKFVQIRIRTTESHRMSGGSPLLEGPVIHDMLLHRLPQAQAGEASGAPPAR